MNSDLILSLSDQYGFQTDVLEKIYRLTSVLEALQSNPYLISHLALKGGTAINFLYFGFPRLSVDLDFDFTTNVPRDEMLIAKEDIRQVLDEVLSELPYRFQLNSTDSSLNYHLAYKTFDGFPDHIKLDLNFRTRAHVLLPINQLFYSLFHEHPIQVKALQKEEIFGQKLKALMERTKARDLYDAYNLVNRLRSEPDFLNIELLHKIFIYYVCTSNHDFRDLRSSRIDILEENDIADNLLPVLRDSDTFPLPDVKQILFPFIEELLALSGSEIDFVNLFYDEAIYQPELLFTFPYQELQYRVNPSPAIQWKLYNLRKHLGKG